MGGVSQGLDFKQYDTSQNVFDVYNLKLFKLVLDRKKITKKYSVIIYELN